MCGGQRGQLFPSVRVLTGLAVRSCTSKPSCPLPLKSASNSRRAASTPVDRENGPRPGRPLAGGRAAGGCGCSLLPRTGKWSASQVLEVGALTVLSLSPGVSAPGRTFKAGHSHGLSRCEPSGATREEVGACSLSCLGDITLCTGRDTVAGALLSV